MIVAGSIPMKTQVASVYVYREIELQPQAATSVSVLNLPFICGAAAVGAD